MTRSRRYLAQTIMDPDYADNIAPLANTSTKAESLLHSLEQAAGGIGLHVNVDKMSTWVLIKSKYITSKIKQKHMSDYESIIKHRKTMNIYQKIISSLMRG